MTTKDYEQRIRELNERERYLIEKEKREFLLNDRLREIIHDRINVKDRIAVLKTKMWPYDTGDLPFDDKYFEAQKELIPLESRLKNLNEKEHMIESILEPEMHNQAPITVPQNRGYEISNGLLGVNRDLLADDRDLQQMYDISRRPYHWKDHFAFKMKRPHQPPPNLDPEPLGRKSHKK
jgi:hypothetical protein